MVRPLILLALLGCGDAPEATVVPSPCEDYCTEWQLCGNALPAWDWATCDTYCDTRKIADAFVTCMDEAWPASQIEEYGPDADSCTTLYETCSAGVLPGI